MSEEARFWTRSAFAMRHPGQLRPAAEVQLSQTWYMCNVVDLLNQLKTECRADYLTRLGFVVFDELGSSHASL
ncbi:hypothetical protein NKI66_21135 [Mesorhizobium sp. M0518]|uniref:hypothetical protein n=1 Tax=Mesorhizobium sp. M0518 TaxID=2956956 RepID=UPI003337D102